MNNSTLGIGVPNTASSTAPNIAMAGGRAEPSFSTSSSTTVPGMTPMVTHAADSHASAVATPAAPTRAALPIPPTHFPYQQLLDLLMRAVQDVTLYRQVYGQRYVVPLQMVGNHLNFNIVKQKQVDRSSISSNSISNKKKGEKVKMRQCPRAGPLGGNRYSFGDCAQWTVN